MKIRSSIQDRAEQGSTLMIVVVVTALVGFVLAAYLTLLSSQNRATVRSQAWNATVPIIEAGVEDALMHLNAHGTTNLLCDGWQQSGGIYWIGRAISDNYYLVTISNWVAGSTNHKPVVESRGYVSTPTLTANSGQLLLATLGQFAGKQYLGRGVRVVTKQDKLFVKGIVAKGTIDLQGNNIKTDSFDSSDTNYNTGGLYDASKNKAGGDVATNMGVTNSLDVGNAEILGKVSTGPGGSVSMGPNGYVGDKTWHSDVKNKGKVQTGWSTDDMNVDFPDVKDPPSGGFTPSARTVDGVYYDYVLDEGNWELSTLSFSGSQKMLVTSNATLYVSGTVSMTGNSYIQIANGASLKMYVGGPSAVLGGNGILNMTGNATNFVYYGLPTNTSLDFSGNASFTGLVYAPNADFSLGGGGSTTYDFVGASITKTVHMNGHFNFHYDEALAKFGPPRGFVITTWNEMTPQEVASLPFTIE